MAGTWKGFGTKYYGSKDQNSDDSFITTEWIVILFFPILPIASYRVIYGGTERGLGRSTSYYLILKKLGLDWAQVLLIYFSTLTASGVAILTGWFVGNLFSATEWGPFAAIMCSFIPIIVTIKLFLEAKPSAKPRKRISRKPEKAISTKFYSTQPAKSSEANYPIKEVDISQIPMPNISPPTTISVPDINQLNSLLDKYEPLINKVLNERKGDLPIWVTVKFALEDTLSTNYQSINYFMTNEVFENRIDKVEQLNELVKTFTTLASTYAWIVGLEWGRQDPRLKARFINTDSIRIEDVPTDALQQLILAVYFPYYLFAMVFNDYYESEYGINVRFQKDGHLQDTYQGMMKGVLACFLTGVRSN